ncbi:MAG: Diguanylate cyclase [Acidobacteria bacterium]|nr:Diguanylate cyclase [Acidobacteriota bacterium]
MEQVQDPEIDGDRVVVEYARDLILVLDPAGVIQWASPSHFAVLGRDPSSLAGIHCAEHIHPDDRQRQRDAMRERLTSGDWCKVDLRIRHANGSWVDIESLGVPVASPDGKIDRIIITGRDITARKAIERRFIESEQRMRLVMQQLPVNLWTTDRSLVVTSSLGGGLELIGLAPDQLVGASLEDAIRGTPNAVRVLGIHQRALEGEVFAYEAAWNDRDLFVSIQPLRDIDGEIDGVLGLSIDITERKHAERRYQALFERNLAGVFRATVSGMLLECNEAFAKMFGYSTAREMARMLTRDLYYDPADRDEVIALLEARGELRNFERKFRRRDGQIVWALLNETLVHPQAGGDDILEGTIIDITARKLAEERMQYQAFHDSLTDLPNRFLLNDRLDIVLKQARRHGRSAAVMFLDLDHFKLINDTMAHTAGDELLRAVAERLTGCLRSDDTVARIGGDEFVFILAEVDQGAGAAKVAQKILEAVRCPMTVAGRELYVTASIGIALYPNDGIDSDTLVKNADSAMYRAKELGRNMYQFHTPVTQQRAEVRLTLETALRRALERDEFELYYQPQVELATGRITRLEALIRWNRPGTGLVEPKHFIPLAEEIGSIVAIGEWALRTACKQLREWHRRGFTSLGISVNLSPRQFQHERLTAMVEEALDESDLDPRSLELELTESLSMRDSDLTVGRLSHFRAMGIRVSLDDFGSGYSSLGHLRMLPIDTVKIDRSFIIDLSDGAASRAIVQAIVTMAQALQLRVVAEGVETEEQRRILTELGCDEIQGYIFSRPLPVAEVEKLLVRSS